MFCILLILIFCYLITGLISHCIDIYNFFVNTEYTEDKYDVYKRQKLNG